MRSIVCIFFWVGLSLSLSQGQVPTPAPALAGPPPKDIAARLGDPNPKIQAQGVTEVESWFKADPRGAAYQLRGIWQRPVWNQGEYSKIAAWALTGVLAVADDTDVSCDLMELRIRALWKVGRDKEALSACRSLFNLAKTGRTNKAILMVARGLERVHPQDPTIYDRFRQEQMAGAVRDGQARHSALLEAIPMDKTIYAAALEAWKLSEMDEWHIGMAEGNLHLLMGELENATPIFTNLPGGSGQQDVENQSRIMKAQDGTIGRVNHYLLAGER